jgi:integrase
LASWLDRWKTGGLTTLGIRETTQRTYAALARSCIRPDLGWMPLADIRPSHIDAWLANLAEAGKATSTRRQALTVLRACLASAVRDGLIGSNPADEVKRPPLHRLEAAWWGADGIRALLSAAEGHRLFWLLRLLSLTRLRRGEALALTWEHVSLDSREAYVRGTLVRMNGGLRVNPPKSRAGWRTIPLSAPVVAALRAQQQQRLDRIAAGPSWIGSPFVFNSEAGTPLDPRNVGRWFDAVVKRAGLVGSLHTFRHSALSVMAENGVPMSTI